MTSSKGKTFQKEMFLLEAFYSEHANLRVYWNE